MTPLPVRIGLVGYGKGGRHFHAPLIARTQGCQLAGVVVRSPQRRADLAADHADVPAYGSLGELADAGVDAVVVCTPLDSHVRLVLEAVERGLPVACDKPFAPDAPTARETVLAAERAGVMLTVYQNRRWDADFLTVRQVLTSVGLGDVISFESRMERHRPESGFSSTGGGVLRDFGSHIIDQALQIFGPVRSLYAEMQFDGGADALDYRFFLALRHVNGASSHLIGDWSMQDTPGPRFRVVGSTGTFVVGDDDGQSERLLSGRTPLDERGTWGSVPEEKWGRLYQDGLGRPIPSQAGSWDLFYSSFVSAVRDNTPPPVDPWDAVEALLVLDAARLSATTGQVVELREGSTRRP